MSSTAAIPHVFAVRFKRNMRGHSRSILVEGDDGHQYVVKLVSNPLGTGSLFAEIVGSAVLRALQISSPHVALIAMPFEILTDAYPDQTDLEPPSIWRPTSRVDATKFVHFGSRYVADPAKQAVFDFLPDAFLNRIVNRADFLGTLLVDLWLMQTDSRQAVFTREGRGINVPYRAYMIDNNGLFNIGSTDGVVDPRRAGYFRTRVAPRARFVAAN